MRSLVTFLAFTVLSISTAYSQLPVFTATVWGTPAPGYYFLSPFSATNGAKYQYILDGSGNLIYYKKLSSLMAFDFKKQMNEKMTFYYSGGSINKFIVMDSTFRNVDTLGAVGYPTDQHELQMLSNGNYLVLGSENYWQNLSSYNYFNGNGSPGSSFASVKGAVIQEIDPSGKTVFEWHSRYHFAFSDVDPYWMTSPSVVDWTHSNALELDRDGNILLSTRYFNEITKINHTTRDIMWRFGGKNNQFTFTSDTTRFYGQHDIRRLSNGHVTLFDNGNYTTPHGARACEYELDEVNKTAKLVWSYEYDPAFYSTAMGNVQRLVNRNTLINYGSTNSNAVCFNVVDTMGNEVFRLSFLSDYYSYRSFYYNSLPWKFPRTAISCFDSLGKKYLKAQDGFSDYEWSTGATTQSIPLTAPGTYFVYTPFGNGGHLRSQELKIQDVSKFCNKPTAVSNLNSPETPALYPNPAHDKLTYIPSGTTDQLRPHVRDMQGRTIELPITLNQGRDRYILDVSQLKTGLYFLVSGNTASKFIKD